MQYILRRPSSSSSAATSSMLFAGLCFVLTTLMFSSTTQDYFFANAFEGGAPHEHGADIGTHAHATTIRDGMTHDDVRLAGHLAYYALASIIRFPNMKDAMDKIADINAGKKNFRQVAEDMNNEFLVRGETKQSSGEIGLITYNDVPTPVAKLLFDIRNAEANEKSMNLLGPVQTDDGVYIATAFKRYRKSFFSRSWWELAEFCGSAKMKTSDMLQLLENPDRLWQMAFMIWPEEHVTFKRLKIRQVRDDFKKIGLDDPSVLMPAPKKKLDPHLHKLSIEQRIAFIKKMDPKLLQEHPEIYGMSEAQIREHGWHPDISAAQRAKERFASQSKSETGEKEIDPSLIAH